MRSFVDVLFILLLATMVMLSQAVPLGAADAELLRVGGGAVSPIRASDVRVVIVGEDALRIGDRRMSSLDDVAAASVGTKVLLVSGSRRLRHARIMSVWTGLKELGVDVHLGAVPADAAPEAPTGATP